MKNKILILIFFNFLFLNEISCQMSEYVKWQTLQYKNLPDSIHYNASVNIPFGVINYKNKLLVSIPRRNPGIPATLNYVELNGNPPYVNPLLVPYPNFNIQSIGQMNYPDPTKFVSVYRMKADKCGNLWFIDTGTLEYSRRRQAIQNPSLWRIDLETDRVMWRYEFPDTLVTSDGTGLIALTLDDDNCSEIFVYIPDIYGNSLIVVDTKNGKSWRFTHSYMMPNPFEADFNVDGFLFQWNDGIFSIALSNKKPDGFKTAFFHPLVSYGEFTVSTKILRNETLASRQWHNDDFKFIGHTSNHRGIHCYDSKNKVLLFADMDRHGISCWSPLNKESMKKSEVHLIAQNNQTMIYPVDIKIDENSNLWVISNRLPRFIYGTYDYNLFNFVIFKAKTDNLLKGTGCK